MKPIKILFSFLFVLQTLWLNAQQKHGCHKLKCSGQIPEEFIEPAMLKAKNDYQRQELLFKAEGGRESETITKEKRKFHIMNHYISDKLLKSGMILFNDSISLYINSIADKILANNLELREQVRFYTVKSASVNAFTVNQGIIFVNVGLLARLESEDQLAFVLCHEIAHYIKGHSLEGYLNRYKVAVGANGNQNLTYNDKLLSISNFSKNQELEADALGFELFAKTNYNQNAAIEVLEILKTSYLVFDDLDFDETFLNCELIKTSSHISKIKTVDSTESEIVGIQEDTEDRFESNDSFSTHPSAQIRIEKIEPLLDSLKATNVEVESKRFLKMKNLARVEVVRIYLLTKQYHKALYALSMLENNIELSTYKVMAINGWATRDQYDREDELDFLFGAAKSLDTVYSNFSKNELNIL